MVATPQSGVPWTGPGVDDLTQQIIDNNEAAADAADLGPELAAQGVPTGGTTGQVLAKASDDDYDDEWVDPGPASPLNDDLSADGHTITDLAAPEGDDDAATKGYVDESLAAAIPIVNTRTSGDLALANTGATWTDVDPDGTSTSRPLDFVATGAVAGKKLSITPNIGVSAAAVAVALDLAIIAANGSVIRRVAATSAGIGGWLINNVNAAAKVSGTYSFPIEAGDIVSGQVRVRLQYVKNSATARTFFASAGAYPLQIEGRGPF